MHKKLFSIFINLATSIILLGHSFVPHHHHEAQHSHGHEHHHHNDQGGLKDLFAHHCHTSDYFTSVHKHEVSQLAHQQVFDAVISESYYIYTTGVYRPARHKYSCDYVYISPHFVNLDFRGPPSPSV
jgi:hypothetical protein